MAFDIAPFDVAPDGPKVFDLTDSAATPAGADLSLDQAVAALIVAGQLSLNLDQTDTFRVDLTSDVSGIAFTAWPTGGRSKRVAIYFVQDQVGGHAVTWPASIKWANGIPHSVSAQAGAIDCFVFGSFDGGRTIFGNVVGLAYA